MVIYLQQYLEIGKIINTHGVSGELKILPLTDDPTRYYELEWVFIEKEKSMVKYSIEKVKIAGRTIILKFKEINNLQEAERFKGMFIKIDRKYAVKLPEHTYFISDVLGCKVYEILNEDTFDYSKELGVVIDVIVTGSNDVYVVKQEGEEVEEEAKGRKDGKGTKDEILIPALKSVVKKVLIKDKKMWVLLPEGLVMDE